MPMKAKEKILFFSHSGCSLPIVWRLRRAGFDAEIYIEERRYAKCYENMLGQVKPARFGADLKNYDLVVWDMPPGSYNSSESVRAEKDMERGLRDHMILSELLQGFQIIQNHYLMDGDLGPKVLCQGSLIHYDPPAGNSNQVEPTADAVYAMLSLAKDGWPRLFDGSGIRFNDSYCASQRISIPPYPYLDVEIGDGVTIENNIERLKWFWPQDVMRFTNKWVCAQADGLLGVATGIGETINEAWGRCYQHIRTLRVTGARIQYRKDGVKSARRELKHREAAVC